MGEMDKHLLHQEPRHQKLAKLPHSSWMLKNIVKVRDTVGNTQHWEEANRNGKYQTTTMYRELHGEK